MRAEAERHFNRLELQRQLVHIARVDCWEALLDKYPAAQKLLTAEKLNAHVQILKQEKASRKKGHVGWYASKEEDGKALPHQLVVSLLDECEEATKEAFVRPMAKCHAVGAFPTDESRVLTKGKVCPLSHTVLNLFYLSLV